MLLEKELNRNECFKVRIVISFDSSTTLSPTFTSSTTFIRRLSTCSKRCRSLSFIRRHCPSALGAVIQYAAHHSFDTTVSHGQSFVSRRRIHRLPHLAASRRQWGRRSNFFCLRMSACFPLTYLLPFPLFLAHLGPACRPNGTCIRIYEASF